MARGGIALKLPPTVTVAPVTAEAVHDWIRSAAAGDVLVYFTGVGAVQSVPAVAAARRLSDDGKVCLFQQRRGPALFDYCMKKRAMPDRKPLSRAQLDAGITEDLKDLLKAIEELALANRVCPSNPRLAELAGLRDGESVRYRLILLAQAGHIDVRPAPSGARIITITATGAQTSAGGLQ